MSYTIHIGTIFLFLILVASCASGPGQLETKEEVDPSTSSDEAASKAPRAPYDAEENTTVEGLLRKAKGGWVVGDMVFVCNDQADLERVSGFLNKHVKMIGRLVQHRVSCPETQIQCRTGEWYYTFEPLTSVEAINPPTDKY